MPPVATIVIRVEAAHQFSVARSQRPPIGVVRQTKYFQGGTILAGEGFAILAACDLCHPCFEAGSDRVERISEICPARGRRAGTRCR